MLLEKKPFRAYLKKRETLIPRRKIVDMLDLWLSQTVLEKQIFGTKLEDVLYYERLPNYETVYRVLVDYTTTPFMYREFFDFVNKYGIFQFWNVEYISCLANEIKSYVGSNLVLEVAAGDGMLSYWLRQYGVNIHATDSGEWYIPPRTKIMQRAVVKPYAPVEIIDAISAIRKYKPKMVIASWITEGVDFQIFDEKPPIICLIGEVDGATGSMKFWEQKYWEKAGYERLPHSRCDEWNLCRTDYVSDGRVWHHSYTIFFIKKG
jgi:hypothetical protein